MKSKLPLTKLARLLLASALALICVAWTTNAKSETSRDTVADSGRSRDTIQRDFSPGYLAERLGVAQKTSKLIGVPVRDKNNHKVGRLQDLVLDASSGRVLAVLVSCGDAGTVVAVPPRSFYSADENSAVLEMADPNLGQAPRLATSTDAANICASLSGSYAFFNQKNNWDGKAAPAQAAKWSEISGVKVTNKAGEPLGTLVNLMVDLPTGRATFAVVNFAGTDADLYAAPPSAFQKVAGQKALLLAADKATVSKLAHSDGFFWSDMADVNYGITAYRNFGSEPDFAATAAPTPAAVAAADPTHEQVRSPVETAPPAPATDVKSDSEIQREVLTALMRDNLDNAVTYKSVKFNTVKGQMTLSGKVRTDLERAKLVAIVASVVGTANVHDQMQLK